MYRFEDLVRPLAFSLMLNAWYGLVPNEASAQPAPTFHVACEDLRDAIAEHGIDGSVLTTIRVEGEITALQEMGLVYVLICNPPDPLVLCVTYGTNGNQIGDRVVVGGAFTPKDENHIMLDPCLHGPPERYRDH